MVGDGEPLLSDLQFEVAGGGAHKPFRRIPDLPSGNLRYLGLCELQV